MVVDLTTESLEAREDDKDERPGVEQREGKVHEKLVPEGSLAVSGLDDEEDGGDAGAFNPKRTDGSATWQEPSIGPRRTHETRMEKTKAVMCHERYPKYEYAEVRRPRRAKRH